ncbi:lipid-A-disaccharide synthase [Cysteiniphilum sp. QT6929]|uniref:lipid-A-disaccharide synthase n=1 Tax=Cysteiniphilum sp. QT6929 TaxID=2975055 RepID=UPI0024B33B41|nr:lipid-A-disaccharide synthase [Cysteiniphilum sp. QT6929]WHN65284.1 lipid-A-disaccharide synthase [Cysteiniphilum sp. QT6929]
MRIMLVAGELSGDQLGAGVVRLLKQHYPHAILEGIGGQQMIDAGLKSLYPIDTLSVMGIFEVLKHLPAILKVRKGIIKHCQDNPPDIYIGIDAPDFNLPIEAKLKARGIKTAHYVSPSVWAWREGRMKKIKRATDVVFAILPFEEAFYQKHKHKAIFVGHPLANKVPMNEDTVGARKQLDIDTNPNRKVIALLPGSRTQEVIRILPVFLHSIAQLKRQGYEFDTLLPVAKESLYGEINKHQELLDKLNIQKFNGNAHMVLQACDFALVASGTAALETMLYKKPMVIGYQMSTITAAIVKHMLKTKFVGLPNILADKEIVPELLQKNFTANQITHELKRFFDDQAYTQEIKATFHRLHQLLMRDADRKVSDEIINLLDS